MDFLDGKSDEVMADIRRKMDEAAESMQFERAAAMRDKVVALQKIAA